MDYINKYVFPETKMGGSGGIPFSSIIDPTLLTTATAVNAMQTGGKDERFSNLYIPGGLVSTSFHSLDSIDTRTYTKMDAFQVPVIGDLYDDLLDLVSIPSRSLDLSVMDHKIKHFSRKPKKINKKKVKTTTRKKIHLKN